MDSKLVNDKRIVEAKKEIESNRPMSAIALLAEEIEHRGEIIEKQDRLIGLYRDYVKRVRTGDADLLDEADTIYDAIQQEEAEHE